MRLIIGKLLQLIGFPGLIRSFSYRTRNGLEVWVTFSERYTVLHLGREALYFWREDGRYDGWSGYDGWSADIDIVEGAEFLATQPHD